MAPTSSSPAPGDSAQSAATGEAVTNPGAESLRPQGPGISWLILLITTLAILMTSIDQGILPAVLPDIKKEFGLDNTESGFINSMFFLGVIAGALFFGFVSDRVGTGYRRTWTWIAAMFLATVGGILTFGLSGTYIAFLFLRLPMGFSRGGSEPVNVALVSEWWPKEHRGFAVGVHHTGFPLGQFLTGALIALVIGVHGWRGAFLLIPLLGIPIIIGQAVLGRRRRQQQVYDWIDENDLTRPTPELSTQAKGGMWEPVKIAMGHSNVRWAVVLIFLLLWGEAGTVTFLTTQFTNNGMSTSQAALVSGASGLTGWIGQVVWSTLSDRSGRRFSIMALVIGWTISELLMITMTGALSDWLVLLFWGLFRNAPFPVLYSLLIDSVPKAAGTAMGIMIGLALGVSGLFAALVQGVVIDHFGFTTDYLMLAAICALGIIPLLRIKETVDVEGHEVGHGDLADPSAATS